MNKRGGMVMHYIGLAGQYRVLSELLMRGFKPATVILDDGIDIVLENGKKLQVKTRRKTYSGGRGYKITLYRNKINIRPDYFLFWLINDDKFLIIPSEEFKSRKDINFIIDFKESSYSYPRTNILKYENKWDLLR